MILDIVSLFEKLGYPIAMSVYLLYLLNSSFKFLGKKIDEIKNIMIETTTQVSFLVSANMSYRAGDNKNGDIFSQQAVYIGDKIKSSRKESKTEVGDGE